MPTPALSAREVPAPPGWRRWWVGARPRTLTMAVTPVIVGASLAWAEGAVPRWAVLLLTLACAVLIQVATNLLNDVSDFERGNDRADRVGPLRVTAAGWATPAEVRRAAWAALGFAALLGLVLVAIGGWVILAIGLFSIAAAWAYSGGRRPVSYRASGELFVLVFFGLVAVTGTHYLQADSWSAVALPAGFAVGSMAAAVLLLNNYRDIAGDIAVGRRTLAAALGPRRARAAFALLMLLPFALPAWLALREPAQPGAWLAFVALPLALAVLRDMHRLAGPALNPVLARTALTQLAFGVLLSVGVLL
ncbi:MAG: 1,4-dihydroxy-2-naphthoate polyprenyltransferase [Steroidobacteraceae bacterium]|jgi:1,4-dihydroxy-2-naphthoate octaprenyltransferase|nr:1,4-dihydroxy-2-naphthoate polyprenyltransferase [Steroidobacteraceae bacterium]